MPNQTCEWVCLTLHTFCNSLSVPQRWLKMGWVLTLPLPIWLYNKSPFSAIHHYYLFGVQGQVARTWLWKPRNWALGSKTPISITHLWAHSYRWGKPDSLGHPGPRAQDPHGLRIHWHTKVVEEQGEEPLHPYKLQSSSMSSEEVKPNEALQGYSSAAVCLHCLSSIYTHIHTRRKQGETKEMALGARTSPQIQPRRDLRVRNAVKED
jgi:hypothetical protein